MSALFSPLLTLCQGCTVPLRMAPTPKPQAAKKAAADGGPAAKNGSQTLTDGELKQLKSGAAKGKESGGAAKAGKLKPPKPPRAGSRSKDKGGVSPLLLIGAGLVAALAWGAYGALSSAGGAA